MSGPRYSTIPAGAITDNRLDGRYDLKVLGLLGTHIDNHGWCFRSQATMAEQLGCGRATVQRALDRLEAAGYIARRAEMRRDGSTTANSYRVILDVADGGGRSGDDAGEAGEDFGRLTHEAGPPAHETGGARPRLGRAGIGTTPVLTKMRESAGGGADEEARVAAERRREAERLAEEDRADVEAKLGAFRPIWPTTRSDDADAVASAMAALGAEEREEAVRAVPVFLAALAADRRKLTISGSTYLGRRRWKPALEAAKSGSPAGRAITTAGGPRVDPLTKLWWAGLLMRTRGGRSDPAEIRKTVRLAAEMRVGWQPASDAERAEAERLAETLRPCPSDGARAAVWRAWFDGRRASLSGLFGGAAFMVFLPVDDPPAHACDDDDLVA